MRTLRSAVATSLLVLALTSCGGGSGVSGGTGTAPTPISLSSAATASVAENSAGTAYQATTTGGSGTVTYTLSGADAAAFTVSAIGALSFKTAPDFEQPADSDKNNIYLVTIAAADSTGSASRDVAVTVTNVADFTAVDQVGGTYFGAGNIASVPGQARLFVAQSNGNLYLVDPATTAQGTLYLSTGGIAGFRQLLAIAAAPDFAASGIIYVSLLVDNAIEIRKYTRSASGVADAASSDVIFRAVFPSNADNIGGWIGFGTDNLLYAGIGNGFYSGNSTSVPPQPDNTSLLGKILRIDPSRDDFPADSLRDYAIPSTNPFVTGGGAAEIYAAGFANPRTASFDGANVYVGDQTIAIAPSSTPLYLIQPTDAGKTFANFPTGSAIPPVLRAGQTLIGAGTLVAGPVYRGPSPDLVGRYLFSVSAGFSGTSYRGVYTVPATSLMQGTTLETRSCCSLFNGTLALSFAQDSARNVYFTDGSKLYAIQYR